MKSTSEIISAPGRSKLAPLALQGSTGDSSSPLTRRAFKSKLCTMGLALAVGLAAMLVTASAWAQTETVLHSFAGPSTGGSGADGAGPRSGLVRDGSGNLYGTTKFGGAAACGCGTVFELVNSSGTYTEKVLHMFSHTGNGDVYPSAGLIMDSSGNLYGTTSGGAYSGAVFEMVNSSGNYTEKVLHSFTAAGGDGTGPRAGLLMNSSGNLYGTTVDGGASGLGTVFELVNSSGSYTEKVLYSFRRTGGDGAQPWAGLIMDASGNLYGTTSSESTSGFGTVFELVNSSGSYTEKVLYSFRRTGGDGTNPEAGLVMDSSGNLYGTTYYGGASIGTVFELVNSSGTYTEKVLHSFTGGGDGAQPQAGLVMDSSGNLYGTTSQSGASRHGTVFELVNSSGTYTEKVLHSFTGYPSNDGRGPKAGLIMDSSGNLYGTTSAGGTRRNGTVFELAAANSPQTVSLSGTGTVSPDFSLAANGSASAKLSAGSSASYSLNIAPSGGFNQSIAFVCTGAPSEATCTVTPASATLDGSATATAAVKVTTMAASAVPPTPYVPTIPRGWLGLLLLGLPVLLAAAWRWMAQARSAGAKRAPWRPITAAATLLLAIALMASCGGGGTAQTQSNPGTPAGSYTLTVTGTSGTLSHAVKLTLTVQ